MNPFIGLDQQQLSYKAFDQAYNPNNVTRYNQDVKRQTLALDVQIGEPNAELDNTYQNDIFEHLDVETETFKKPIVIQQAYTNTLADPKVYEQLNYNESNAFLQASGNSKLINEQKSFVDDFTSVMNGARSDGADLSNEQVQLEQNQRIQNQAKVGMARVQQMADHSVAEAGVDYRTITQKKTVNEQLSNAFDKSRQMTEYIEPRIPKPTDPNYPRNVIPDYALYKQQMDIDNKKVNETATYFNSLQGDADPRKRPLVVPILGVQHQENQTRKTVLPQESLPQNVNETGPRFNTTAVGTVSSLPILRQFNMNSFKQMTKDAQKWLIPNLSAPEVELTGSQNPEEVKTFMSRNPRDFVTPANNRYELVKPRDIGPSAQMSEDVRRQVRDFVTTRITAVGDQAVYNNAEMSLPIQFTDYNQLVMQSNNDATYGAKPMNQIIPYADSYRP